MPNRQVNTKRTINENGALVPEGTTLLIQFQDNAYRMS